MQTLRFCFWRLNARTSSRSTLDWSGWRSDDVDFKDTIAGKPCAYRNRQRNIAPMTTIKSPAYIGRFAPTPSGYLHFGSLVAALASYLDARSVGGHWLVRMEDLDPPREEPGAQVAILAALEHYGFEWDGEMVRQSDRHDAYAEVINRLFSHGLAYACTCSRKQLEPYHGVYPGLCRNPRRLHLGFHPACPYRAR